MVNITSDEPDFSSFLDGDGMGGGLMGFSPLNLKFNNNETQSSGSFSTSLQQFLKLQGKLEGSNNFARGRSGGTDDDLPGVEHSAPYSPANIWVKGRWSRSKEDRGNIDEKSDYSIVYVGADYRYKPDLLVGFMGQLDWSDEKSEGLGFEAEGRGWMLGPYIVTRLSDNLILDLRSTWGKSDNKINPIGTYWDEFETERWQLKGNLTGSFDYGDWNIRPSVGLSYFEETQEEYTDSNGFVIDEQTFSLGTLDFGPTFTYTYRNDDGLLIKPLIGIKGIWDFDAPDILDVNGIAVGTEELRAKLKLGLSMRLPSGTSMHGSYSYDGIGVSDYESHTGQLAISVPIGASWLPKGSMFQGSCAIQGVNSFSNLNQADSDEDYKVNFSLKIPWD
jgi:outer membrane autotransporter protein